MSESPNPSPSTAIVLKVGASAATVGRNDALVPPRPCSISTGGPLPASRIEKLPSLGADAAEAQPAGRVGRGRRKEADAEVEVAADLKPAPPERLHALGRRRCRSTPRSRWSASIVASGLPAAGPSRAFLRSTVTSQSGLPAVWRRITARSPGRSKNAWSKRATKAASAAGAVVRDLFVAAAKS